MRQVKACRLEQHRSAGWIHNLPDQGQLLFILYCGILVVGQQKIVHSMTRKISSIHLTLLQMVLLTKKTLTKMYLEKTAKQVMQKAHLHILPRIFVTVQSCRLWGWGESTHHRMPSSKRLTHAMQTVVKDLQHLPNLSSPPRTL